MEQRMTMITLGVQDLWVAEQFYSRVLGWKKTADSDEQIIFYSLPGILLSLYPLDKLAEDAEVPPEQNGPRGFTLSFNTRSRRETDQLFDELRHKGVTILKAPKEAFWGGYSGYITDPDGHLIEIAYNPYLSLDENGVPVKEQ